jgi:hypothetical protein
MTHRFVLVDYAVVEHFVILSVLVFLSLKRYTILTQEDTL